MHKLFSKDKQARLAWDEQAVWYRLRYTDPTAVRKCLHWLSTAQKVGRVALWQQVTPDITRLHIGIPSAGDVVLHRMAVDYHFSLQPKLAQVPLPPAVKLAPLTEADLPWEVSFLAHLVGGRLFVALLVDGVHPQGVYLPALPDKKRNLPVPDWTVPTPRRGTSRQPVWPPVNGAHSDLAATSPQPQKWLLGRDARGTPLQAGGCLNLYGDERETAAWLAHMAGQLIRLNPHNLIVIDGCGNLVPQLKRTPTILRLMGARLQYIDMDNPLLATGFNPLAPVPGEAETQIVQRWQHWFSDMGVHRSNLPTLAEAFAQGIRELSDLRRWLDEPDQQVRPEVTASLRRRLELFLETRAMREWMDWPDNPFRLLPDGALLFACRGDGWARVQLLNAILLGALHSPDARLILHGIPWRHLPVYRLPQKTGGAVITSNGPLFSEGKVILVRCHQVEAAALLAARFFPDNTQMGENVQLLQRGESVVISNGEPVYTTWDDPL